MNRNAEGFTLIEVILAMVLLSVATLALLSVLLGGFAQRETSREYDLARNAAFAKLEEIRGCEFANVYTRYNNTYFAVTDLDPPTGWANPGKITINNAISDLYDVTVTIRWQIKGNASALVFNQHVIRSLLTRGAKY